MSARRGVRGRCWWKEGGGGGGWGAWIAREIEKCSSTDGFSAHDFPKPKRERDASFIPAFSSTILRHGSSIISTSMLQQRQREIAASSLSQRIKPRMSSGADKASVAPDRGGRGASVNQAGAEGGAATRPTASARQRRRRPLSHLGVQGELPFPIPRVKKDLTPEWLQRVLRANDVIPATLSIRAAKIEPGDHGFHSDIFKV